MSHISLAIHGGAGTIRKEDMTAHTEKEYLQGLTEALNAGYHYLEQGGTAVEAVTITVRILEDNILFNAGKGSVFTKSGRHEMDASIMDGSNLQAGAVAGVQNVKNPILLAREVMLHSNHVFLNGQGAEEFGRSRSVAFESDDYFFSSYRHEQWKEIRDTDGYSLEHSDPHIEMGIKDKKFGTIGAVACDGSGNIAAATSTGGMTNKHYNRIGDSPIIGAGTYANNRTCAISCTGHGELFMRAVAAYDVSCLMEYKGFTLQQAMEEVVLRKLMDLKGEGGMIGVDAKGNTALIFNSEGMYRGVKTSQGIHEVSIYKV
ncbi:MAG TPA: isoaspartyl peptidase/L-asparaginase [Flavisolibacter sp.]|nr:isoaspartyl peptidase/L-asparaginase [Flavisolibacter sp.]